MCDKAAMRDAQDCIHGRGMSYTALYGEKKKKKEKPHSTGTEFQEDYIR